MPSRRAGGLSPGFAYMLYFRLIAHAGPANALAVTYLIARCCGAHLSSPSR